jgi:hypothetical protein
MEFFGPQDLHGNATGPPSSEHPITATPNTATPTPSQPPRTIANEGPAPVGHVHQTWDATWLRAVALQFRPRLVEASDQLGEHLDREGERQADIHIVGRRWGPSLRRARPPPLRVYAPLAVQQHAASR